jgi:hypothetical protein
MVAGCLTQEVQLQRTAKLGSSAGSADGASTSGRAASSYASAAFGDQAAGIMARVRSRLTGYDSGSPAAAEGVLDLLLAQCGGYVEELATLLPQAFTPPGLAAAAAPGPSPDGRASPASFCTTPPELLAAVRARQSDQQQLPQQEEELLAELALLIDDYDRAIWQPKTARERLEQ